MKGKIKKRKTGQKSTDKHSDKSGKAKTQVTPPDPPKNPPGGGN